MQIKIILLLVLAAAVTGVSGQNAEQQKKKIRKKKRGPEKNKMRRYLHGAENADQHSNLRKKSRRMYRFLSLPIYEQYGSLYCIVAATEQY